MGCRVFELVRQQSVPKYFLTFKKEGEIDFGGNAFASGYYTLRQPSVGLGCAFGAKFGKTGDLKLRHYFDFWFVDFGGTFGYIDFKTQ